MGICQRRACPGLAGLLAAEGRSVVQETPLVSIPVRCLPHRSPEGLQSATVLSKASENSSDSSEKCSMIPYAVETKSFHPIITHVREATGPARAPCLGKRERESFIELWRARGRQRDGNVHPCLLLPFNPLSATDLQRPTAGAVGTIREVGWMSLQIPEHLEMRILPKVAL